MAEPNPFTGFEPREARRQPRALWTICLIQFGFSFMYADVLSPRDWTAGLLNNPATDLSPLIAAIVLATLATVPGGWIADRFIGARRAVLCGCVGMSLATVGLFIPVEGATSAALAAAVIGNGLFSPNISVLLSRTYGWHDPHRYAGFALLQASSLFGGLAVLAFGFLYRWLGGVASAIPVVVTLMSYATGRRYLGALAPEGATVSVPSSRWQFLLVAGWPVAFIAIVIGLTVVPSFERLENQSLSNADSLISLALVLGFFGWAALSRRWSHLESGRIQAIAALAIAAAVLSALPSLAREPTRAFAESDWWGLTLASLESFTGWLSVAVALLFAWGWQRRSKPLPGPRVYAYGLLLAAGVLAAGSFSKEQLFVRPAVIGVLLSMLDRAVVAPVGTALITRIAPVNLTGTTVAIWDLVGFAASAPLALAGDPTEPGVPIIAAVVGLCLIVAVVLFTQTGRLESMIEGPSSPPRPAGSRFLRPAMYAAVTLVAVVMVWTVVQAAENRNPGTFAVPATPTFRPEAANLPADDMLGFVAIAGAPYEIGVPPGYDRLAARDESPAHFVALPAFLIGKHEVTVAQFKQCVQESSCVASDLRALDGPDDWPVRFVNWNEAMAYCAWLEKKLASLELPKPLGEALSRLKTRSVSLPSEAEWEAAAQGDVGPYPWAATLTPLMANYAASGRLTPVPIGTFARAISLQGLMDVSGNVAEWTRSSYREYPFTADSQGTLDSRSDRVIRGGSFYDDVTLLRTTSRQVADAATGYDFVGFRVVVGVVVSQSTGAAGR